MEKQYQVLARKYRPQKFKDVVGQQNVLTTLKNALQFDQAAHAYVFCGPRGVGKTTFARLFAKALNCLQRGENLEPCNQCASCLDINSGQSLDVLEIDGASNRGIDDIRQINETASYAPTHGKYKIYIIDEVHMLTKEAFNALLKTLEEPPGNTKFFFATTEPHKVLPTIISRCQRFDLSRIHPNQISRKLAQIAKDLNREVEEEALELIASFADGSLRDAESLFDQILCFSPSHIQASTVREALGLVAEHYFSALDEAFAQCRIAYAFELVETIFQTGKDFSYFLEQLIEHYRTICLCKTVAHPSLPEHLAKRYMAASAHYTGAQALYILDLLIGAGQTMQKSPFPRVTLESTLLHLIRSKHRIPAEVLVRRLHALEEALTAAAPKEELPSIPPEEPLAAPSVFSSKTPPLLEESPSPTSIFTPPEPEPIVEEPPLPSAPSVFAPPPSAAAPSFPLLKFSAPSVFAPIAKSLVQRDASHYETIMRFAAVELEGTLKM